MFKKNFKSQVNPKKASPTAKLDLSKFTETGIPKRAILSKDVKSNGPSSCSQSKETIQLDFDSKLLEKLINARVAVSSPVVKFQAQHYEKTAQTPQYSAKSRDTPIELSARPASSKGNFQREHLMNDRSPGSKGGIINKQSELIFTKLKKARSEQASRENSLSRADGRDSQVCSQNNTHRAASKEQINSSRAQGEKVGIGSEGKMAKQIEKYMATAHFGTSSMANLGKMENSMSKMDKSRAHLRSQSTVNLNNAQPEEISEPWLAKAKPTAKTPGNSVYNTARSISPQNSVANLIKSNLSSRPATSKAQEKIIMNRSQSSNQKPEILKYSLNGQKKTSYLNNIVAPKTQLKLRSTQNRQSSMKNLHSDSHFLGSASHNNSISNDISKECRSVSPSELSFRGFGSTKNANSQKVAEQPKQSARSSANLSKITNMKQINTTQGFHTKSNFKAQHHSFNSSITSTSATAHKDSAFLGLNSISKSNVDEQVMLNQSQNYDEADRMLKDIPPLIHPDKLTTIDKRTPNNLVGPLKLPDQRNMNITTSKPPEEEQNEELKTEINSLKDKVEKMQGSIARFQQSFSKMMIAQEEVNNKLNMILSEDFSGRGTDSKKSSERVPETIRDYCSDNSHSERTQTITPKSGYQSISDRNTCGSGRAHAENAGDNQE